TQREGSTEAVLRPRGGEVADMSAVAFEPMMRSPLHRAHEHLGATFDRDGAWQYPAAYADPAAGERALSDGVGIADVSARGTIDLRGPLDELFSRVARTSEGWEPGTIVPIEPAPSE